MTIIATLLCGKQVPYRNRSRPPCPEGRAAVLQKFQQADWQDRRAPPPDWIGRTLPRWSSRPAERGGPAAATLAGAIEIKSQRCSLTGERAAAQRSARHSR